MSMVWEGEIATINRIALIRGLPKAIEEVLVGTLICFEGKKGLIWKFGRAESNNVFTTIYYHGLSTSQARASEGQFDLSAHLCL